jgi:hypothetical protein
MMADGLPPAPHILGFRLTATHDGESALLVEIGFQGNGSSWVQVGNEDAVAVMRNADVGRFEDLIGRSWTILRILTGMTVRPAVQTMRSAWAISARAHAIRSTGTARGRPPRLPTCNQGIAEHIARHLNGARRPVQPRAPEAAASTGSPPPDHRRKTKCLH